MTSVPSTLACLKWTASVFALCLHTVGRKPDRSHSTAPITSSIWNKISYGTGIKGLTCNTNLSFRQKSPFAKISATFSKNMVFNVTSCHHEISRSTPALPRINNHFYRLGGPTGDIITPASHPQRRMIVCSSWLPQDNTNPSQNPRS